MAWEQLLDIIAEARGLAAKERATPPQACPRDGEPLVQGPDGTLRCRWDGWTWDGS